MRKRKWKNKPGERGKKNTAEALFQELAEKNGVQLDRRGYPDFILLDEHDEIMAFVEVKPAQSVDLRKGQKRFKRLCKFYKIPFYKWTPGEPFPNTHI